MTRGDKIALVLYLVLGGLMIWLAMSIDGIFLSTAEGAPKFRGDTRGENYTIEYMTKAEIKTICRETDSGRVITRPIIDWWPDAFGVYRREAPPGVRPTETADLMLLSGKNVIYYRATDEPIAPGEGCQ